MAYEHHQLWVSVATAIIGLAIVSVVLSKNAATTSVIGAATKGFGGILGVAVSPISGGGAAQQAAAAVTGGGSPGPSNTNFTTQLAPVLSAAVPLIGAAAQL